MLLFWTECEHVVGVQCPAGERATPSSHVTYVTTSFSEDKQKKQRKKHEGQEVMEGRKHETKTK